MIDNRKAEQIVKKILGIDYRKLSFPFQGLDQRLTGVEEAQVIQGILA